MLKFPHAISSFQKCKISSKISLNSSSLTKLSFLASRVQKNVFQFVLPLKLHQMAIFALLLAFYHKNQKKSKCNKIFFHMLARLFFRKSFFLTRSLLENCFINFPLLHFFHLRFFCVVYIGNGNNEKNLYELSEEKIVQSFSLYILPAPLEKSLLF